MTIIGIEVHDLGVSKSAVSPSVGVGIDILSGIGCGMLHTLFICIGVIGCAVSLLFQSTVGIETLVKEFRHVNVDYLPAILIPEQLGMGFRTGACVHSGTEELRQRVSHVVIGQNGLILCPVILEIVYLKIELLVGIGVAAAVGVNGIRADRQAVVTNGGEIRDGIAYRFVVLI